MKDCSFRRLPVILTVFLILASFPLVSPAEHGSIARVGYPAPDFALKTLNGKDVRLSDFRGKVVLLNFWATWCGWCRIEMPSMERLKKQMEGNDFVILAVDEEEVDPGTVRSLVGDDGYTFEILLDPASTLSRIYIIPGYPTTYIIDRNGIIVERSIGAEEWDSTARLRQLKGLSTR